jgi:hypothetical protein
MHEHWLAVMQAPHQRAVDALVVELGRAVHVVYMADREAPDAADVLEAHRLLTGITQSVSDVARASELDLERVARAWEQIALAQDLAYRARVAVADARLQFGSARLLRQEAQLQSQRAHIHAERIRAAWARGRARPRRMRGGE